MLTTRAAAWCRVSVLIFSILFPTGLTRAATNPVEVIVIQGTVEVARAGQSVWDLASTEMPYRQLNPGDQIRTKDRSRASIRLSDFTLVELGPNSHLELLRPLFLPCP